MKRRKKDQDQWEDQWQGDWEDSSLEYDSLEGSEEADDVPGSELENGSSQQMDEEEFEEEAQIDYADFEEEEDPDDAEDSVQPDRSGNIFGRRKLNKLNKEDNFKEEEFSEEDFHEEEDMEESQWEDEDDFAWKAPGEQDSEEDDMTSYPDSGERNPIPLIVGGVMLLAVIIILCVVVWKMSHKSEDTRGIPLQTSEQTQSAAGEMGQSSQESSSSESSERETSTQESSTQQTESTESSSTETSSSEKGLTDNSNVTMTFKETSDIVTAKDVTNLRTEPSTDKGDETVVVQLKNGETVTRTGTNAETGWSRVEYKGQTLYAVTQYLTTNTKQNSKGSTTKGNSTSNTTGKQNGGTGNTTAGGQDGPNTTDQGNNDNHDNNNNHDNDSNNQNTNDSGSSGGGSVSSNSNQVATIDGKIVEFQNCDDYVSPKIEVNLRGEPSTSQGNDTIHARIEYGEIVHRTGISDASGWSRVEYNGEILYAITSYLYVPDQEDIE